MKELFLNCATLLEQGEDIAMVTIVDHHGSSPRTAGSKMFVRRDGSIFGTIGGGVFEAKAINLAREVLQNGQAVTRDFRFSCDEVGGMDMICGGSARIFIDLLRAACPENAAVCKSIGSLTGSDHETFLITKIETAPGGHDQIRLAMMNRDGLTVGMPLSGEALNVLTRLRKGRRPQQVAVGETSYLVEPIHYMGTVYIFGAGHVSQKLAQLTAFVGFQTVVLDDRAEFANAHRFPQADQIIVASDMDNCVKDLPVNRSSYLVIVTRGHAYDRTVLEQAVKTDAGYIGMIGSRRKRDTIYEYLRRAGVTSERLAQVHSPIGVEIDAETPEEIAVSIVGELIKRRAGLINASP